MLIKKIWSYLFKMHPLKVFLVAVVMIFIGSITVFETSNHEVIKCKEVKSLLVPETSYISIPDSKYLLMHCEKEVSSYYKKNQYTMLWITTEGNIIPAGYALITKIKNAYLEGLNPNDYNIEKIVELQTQIEENHLKKPENKMGYAILDILLTDAFITYAYHQYAGRIHSEKYNTEWKKHISEINPVDSLIRINQGANADSILNSFTCKHPQYLLLQKALQQCYMNDTITSNKHSILEDPQIKSIILNIERWRWLPVKLPDLYIMANIPGFYLIVSDHERDTLEMKIIAGKLQQPTPIFEAKMAYLILNPWWEIPASIAKKEMLPEIKKDRNYLLKNNIKVFENRGKNLSELSINEINWDIVTSNNLKFKFRQLPGTWNALGQIKFIFPNEHDIYFHDTPQHELFSQKVRTFSHGCIRLEKPIELAALLLAKDTLWIRNKINKKQEAIFKILNSPMVYICYWTAWFDINRQLCFAPDIYHYDSQLEKLLNDFKKNEYQYWLSESHIY